MAPGPLSRPVVPIPGTKRVKWIEQNAAALDIELTTQDLAVLEPLAAQVVGAPVLKARHEHHQSGRRTNP